MKRIALVSALMAITLTAQAGDFDITVDRKKDPMSAEKGGVEKRATQTWTGDVKIHYRGFKESPAIQARYIIFVKRQKLGETAKSDFIEKVKGSFDIPSMKGGATSKFSTVDVALSREHLQAGYYYQNGGRGIAEDTIAGVWVKLFQGGTQVAEYINPSSLTGKCQWEQ